MPVNSIIDDLGMGINRVDRINKDTPSDYELLYLPNVPDEKKFRHTEWPRRIIVVNSDKKPMRTSFAFTDSALDLPKDKDSVSDKEDFILKVYDIWINLLLNRRGLKELTVSIYFDSLNNACNNWEIINIYKPNYIKNIDTLVRGDALSAGDIMIWRHIKLKKACENYIKNQKILYYQHGSYVDAFFSYLCSIDPSNHAFQCKYFLRQLVEMALFRVVIIDERISQTLADKANKSDLNNSLIHNLAWMGIWVAGEVVFQKPGKQPISIVIGTVPTTENGLVKIIFELDDNNIKSSLMYGNETSTESKLPKLPSSGIELLSVHQTIIDNKFKKPLLDLFEFEEKDWKEKWIDSIRPDVLFVYSHSGRGHVRKLLPRNASFIEYSFFQTHILSPVPSKFFFIQLLLASKEEGSK